MPSVADLDLPGFDEDPRGLSGDRFHAAMRALRERSWLVRATDFGYFVLDREAGELFLRDRRCGFPGILMLELQGVTDGPVMEQARGNLINVEGDAHRRLRGLVNPAFTPRAADRWRPAMRALLEELWAPFEAAGGGEVVEGLAKPYPSRVIATVMGAPAGDAERLARWSSSIQKQFAFNLAEDRPEIERAVTGFYAWARALIARRREAPAGDLVSTLLATDGLAEHEVLTLVLSVLVGGVDTTQSQLAHALRLFAAHPEQWALLAERPELAPNAVEEVLRFEPIVPFTARLVREEIEHRGVRFPPNTLVYVSAHDGNRDPARWTDPEAFDITREPSGTRMLTFGAGVHYCLGANLAKAELQEALRFLPPRAPGLRLDGEAELDTVNGIYGVRSLRIAFDAV